jgi:hypothetical protein
LTDHKLLRITGYDDAVIDRLCDALGNMGLSRKEYLVKVSEGFHHWHHAHPRSLERQALVKKLLAQGFGLWHPGE